MNISNVRCIGPISPNQKHKYHKLMFLPWALLYVRKNTGHLKSFSISLLQMALLSASQPTRVGLGAPTPSLALGLLTRDPLLPPPGSAPPLPSHQHPSASSPPPSLGTPLGPALPPLTPPTPSALGLILTVPHPRTPHPPPAPPKAPMHPS